MKKFVCPTVTADDPHAYREQIERVLPFADRIHIDFADGEFAPTNLLAPEHAWIPSEIESDLHVMFENPAEVIEYLIAMRPRAIILHAEAEGNVIGLLKEIKASGIIPGLALLQNSQPEDYANEIEVAEHVLLFGGHLGYHGGTADLSQLDKADRVLQINRNCELAWDGGINAENAREIVDAGVSILNVGSFVQKAASPDRAYDIINSSISS